MVYLASHGANGGMTILCCRRPGRLHDLLKRRRVASRTGRPTSQEQTRVGGGGCEKHQGRSRARTSHDTYFNGPHSALATRAHQGAVALEPGRVGVIPLQPLTDTFMRFVGVPSLLMQTAYGLSVTCVRGCPNSGAPEQ